MKAYQIYERLVDENGHTRALEFKKGRITVAELRELANLIVSEYGQAQGQRGIVTRKGRSVPKRVLRTIRRV